MISNLTCASVRSIVPVSLDALIASTTGNTRHALALSCFVIALTALRGQSTIACSTAVASAEAIVIGRAAVTMFADDIFLTEALTAVTVATFHPTFVAHAVTTIFSLYSVAKVTWRAQITRLAIGIV